MSRVVRVSFKQVYDLVFRARNSKLNSTAYVLDFRDWLKAGIAFNTRGFEISTRKISYFAKLYSIIQESKSQGVGVLNRNRVLLEQALMFYYEDIYDIYQDHLKAKQLEASQRRIKSIPDFGEVLILPCFDEAPELRQIFETRTYAWDGYVCKNLDDFMEDVPTLYLSQNSPSFKCMSMMYDYGRNCIERGVLLEVELWRS